ncbi:MAG TPA: Ig-like domain-containing protein [Gemmatimonadales bacterium]|nr:Ig-like domain-containing protein [Gemmatimonadales bacterium]
MTFKHKLSSRLALLKDRVVLASLAVLVTAAIVACELPVRAVDPGSTIADLLVSPKTLTLRQNATADFTAVAFMSTGDTATVSVSWSVAIGGSMIDTSSNGKRHYGHYKAGPNPGQYRVVANGTPGAVSDTAIVTVTLAPVSAVSVAPTAVTILAGATAQLQATTTDSLGNVLTGRAVTWASNNSAVTVNGNGLVTAAGSGSATITATSEGKSGTATVTVSNVPVASVTVTPASANLQTGQTVQLTATARDAGGNTLSGRAMTWTSTNASVATVNGSGLVSGAGAGSATITATSEGQSGTSSVTVTFVPVASVTVAPASASVQVGQTVQLTATPRDANGNALSGRAVAWSSTNTTVATVNGTGLVQGATAGSATITATSEGQSGTSAVTVTVAPVATVTVSPAAAAIQPGQTVQLTATTKDANGNILTGRTVTWVSNSNAAATVSSSGLVTGVATGTALITATSEGKSGGAAIAVGTPPPPAGCAPTGGGRCYYVDPAGSDGNPGDSARPFQTVQHAADLVNPGDMVIVRNGVYTGGSDVVSIGRGGSAGNLVVFRSQNKWGAVLDGQNNSSATVVHISTNYVRVEGFEMKGSNHYGVDPSTGTHDIQIAGNNIHDVGRYCESSGIGLSAIDAYSDNLIIEGNWVHDIGRFAAGENGCQPGNDYWMNHDHGVYNGQGTNVIIRNNVFYNITRGWGIQRYGSTVDQLYIVNNTFAFPNPNRDGQIILAASTTNLVIENNIFYLPGQNIGISGTVSGALIDHNLSTGAVGGGGIGSNIVNTDPMFVNPSALDFRLQAGSPAINAGIALSIVLNDFFGTLRPQGAGYDIGAYEFK